MTIAFITSEFPHPRLGSYGGIGSSLRHLANGLVESGHRVILLVYGQKKEDNWRESENLEIYSMQNVKLKGFSWLLSRKKIEQKLKKIHAHSPIDLIEAPDWTGITSFINAPAPVVIRMNGSDTYFCYLEGRKLKFLNAVHEKRALRRADGLIAVSQFTGTLTNRLTKLNRPFEVIPNGIDTTFFSPFEGDFNEPLLLYFGTLARKKGVLELPFIFNLVAEQLPRIRFMIIGKDSPDQITKQTSTRRLMEAMIKPEFRERVEFTGPVPYSEIKSKIQRATVCLFPSYAEAFPLSWLEAMALGKAIVASNIGWAQEMIDDGRSGHLIHPAKHTEWAEVIFQLMANDEKRITLGKQARKKVVSEFDYKVIAKKSHQFYEKVISERNGH